MKDKLIKLREEIARVLYNLSEVKTIDGEVIVYEGELIDGVEVSTYDADGNTIPMPDGDYQLEDGSMIKVVEGKAVITPEEVTVPVETVMEAPITEEPVMEEPVSPSIIEELVAKLSDLEIRIANLEAEKTQMSETIVKMSQHIITDEIKQTPVINKQEPASLAVKRLSYLNK